MKKSNPKSVLDVSPQKLFYLSLVFLVFSLIFFVLSLKNEADTKSRYSYTATAATPFKVGQTVRMGVVSISIQKVAYTKGQKSFTAPPGMHYAIVNLKLTNHSEKPIFIAPASDTYFKEVNGRVAYLTPYSLDNPFRAGELSPGETISGDLSYLVNQQSASKYYVDAVWSGGVLSFEVPKE